MTENFKTERMEVSVRDFLELDGGKLQVNTERYDIFSKELNINGLLNQIGDVKIYGNQDYVDSQITNNGQIIFKFTNGNVYVEQPLLVQQYIQLADNPTSAFANALYKVGTDFVLEWCIDW